MADITKQQAMKELARRELAKRRSKGRMSMTDMIAGAVKNFQPSVQQIGAGVGHAVMNPIETAQGIGQAVMNPLETAQGIGQHFSDRYGGSENIKQTIATDPAGAALDVASILGIGGLARSALPKKGKAKREFIKDAPTAKDIKAEGAALYQQARDANIAIAPDAYNSFLMKLDKSMKGMDSMLHPRMARVVELAKSRAGKAIDLEELDTLRKQMGSATESLDNPSQTRLAKKAQSDLDDFIEDVGGKGGAKYGQAREAWGRMRRTELVEEAIEKASQNASGVENGLRVQFRQLLNNKKKMRGFSKAEKEAIKNVSEGKFTRNTLRRIGRLSPGSGQQGSMLLSTLGGAGGYAAGGIGGAMAVPAAGYVAQKLAEKGTRGAADLARAKVATGTGIPDVSSSPNLLAPASPLLLQAAGLNQPLIPSANPLLPR